ncbi:MAG: diguanylate cyclase domain-containing protein [Leptolyngbyaceae cyanobacterium]
MCNRLAALLQNQWPPKISLKAVLIVPFVVQIAVAVGLVGYLSYRNGKQAVHNVAFQLGEEISDRIDQELHTFLDAPHAIHQRTEIALKLGHINVRDLDGLRDYFWAQVNLSPTVTDLGLGNPQGEVLAVSSVENSTGVVRIVNEQTGYHMHTYEVDAAGQPLDLLKTTSHFDPTGRPWYQRAIATKKQAWSDIFARISHPSLTISAVYPIYTEENRLTAVLYSLVHLAEISDYLKVSKAGKVGQSFIVEPTGLLVATSTAETIVGAKPAIAAQAMGKRLSASNSQNRITRLTSQYIQQHVGPYSSITQPFQTRFQIDDAYHYLQIHPFNDDRGIHWLVVTVIPEVDFIAQINANKRTTIALCLLSLGVAILAGAVTTYGIRRTISRLSKAAEDLALGKLDQRVQPSMITETNRLANAFNLMASQLKISFSELEAKNAELQRLDALKDDFLANTSHELKTPLNGMIGLAESMLSGATGNMTQEQQQNLHLIAHSGHRLLNQVNDILDCSRLKYQKLQLYPQWVSVREVVAMVLQLEQRTVAAKPLQLRNRVPADMPLLYVDEHRLQQIIHNLVNNAVKFTPEGIVEVSAQQIEADPLTIAISVADTGIGIPLNKQASIFKAFEQLGHRSHQRPEGTGLGLAIAHQLAALQNGSLEVTSQVNQGSVFTVTLPLVQPETIATFVGATDPPPTTTDIFPDAGNLPGVETHPAQLAEVASPRMDHLDRAHILIVDDDPVNVRVLQNFLKFAGYQLTVAADGPTALAYLEQGLTPDLILLDVMMPGMTGFEVIQTLRQDYDLQQLPILLLSNLNQPQAIALGLELGANDYLAKPFTRDALLARIRTYRQVHQLEAAAIQLTVTHEQQLAQFLDALPVAVVVYNPDKTIFYFNHQAEQLLNGHVIRDLGEAGIAATYQIYRSGTGKLYPEAELPVNQALRGSCAKAEDLEIHQDETVIPCEVMGTPIFDEQGQVEYALMSFQDISQRQRSAQILKNYSQELEDEVKHQTAVLVSINAQLRQEMVEKRRVTQALQQSQAQLRKITDSISAGIAHVDRDRRYRFVNQAYEERCAITTDEIIGKYVWEIIGDIAYQTVKVYIDAVLTGIPQNFDYETDQIDGTTRTINAMLTPDWENGAVVGYFLVFFDVTDRRQLEQSLQQANHQLEALVNLDGLTQVANRRKFDEYLGDVWNMLVRQQEPIALILLDLDYFKRFNDRYGHQQGDDCLIQVAQAAKSVLQRASDLIARYGGEEFAVILPGVDLAGAVLMGERIQTAIETLAIAHADSPVSDIVTVSMGIASTVPIPSKSADRLVGEADNALYRAKGLGRDRLSITLSSTSTKVQPSRHRL